MIRCGARDHRPVRRARAAARRRRRGAGSVRVERRLFELLLGSRPRRSPGRTERARRDRRVRRTATLPRRRPHVGRRHVRGFSDGVRSKSARHRRRDALHFRAHLAPESEGRWPRDLGSPLPGPARRILLSRHALQGARGEPARGGASRGRLSEARPRGRDRHHLHRHQRRPLRRRQPRSRAVRVARRRPDVRRAEARVRRARADARQPSALDGRDGRGVAARRRDRRQGAGGSAVPPALRRERDDVRRRPRTRLIELLCAARAQEARRPDDLARLSGAGDRRRHGPGGTARRPPLCGVGAAAVDRRRRDGRLRPLRPRLRRVARPFGRRRRLLEHADQGERRRHHRGPVLPEPSGRHGGHRARRLRGPARESRRRAVRRLLRARRRRTRIAERPRERPARRDRRPLRRPRGR